ncbi:hypothetical protein N0V94_009513 [Neodidymelliopsis sp. IMI 364377]|nr:hypothetical protein N0V94_009513 [Neodidymelliopsis sp. IMI 364377]
MLESLISGDAFRNQHHVEGLAQGLGNHRYDQLQGGRFRLLKITRSWVMSHFECTLLEFDLHGANFPAFTAVSYEWGPNSDIRPFNLRVGDKQLAVTESAYRVVCGLAPESGDQYIWCDFICINQSDWDERASQVKMMGDIYANAAKVTVFLNTASAVDYDVCDLASHHLQKVNRSLELPQWDMTRQWTRFNKIKIHENGSLGWQALAKIFERQYWSRAWVVQEIVLAKQLVVIFGDNEFSWDELVRFVEAFEDRGNDGSLDVTGSLLRGVDVPFAQIMMLLNVSRIRDYFHRCEGLGLRDIMSYGPRFNASDPRDNIFAFQGLCSEDVPLSMQPDYRIRPIDLYINSVRETITESLWCLNFAGIGWGGRSLESRLASISDDELPSWTPNWGHTVNKNDLPRLHDPVHRAELRPTLDNATRTLAIHSAKFDIIVKITNFPLLPGPESGFGPGSLSIATLSGLASAAKGFQEDLEAFAPRTYPTGIERDDALWRLLLGNQERDRVEIEYLNNSMTLWISQTDYGSYVLELPELDEKTNANNRDADQLFEKLKKTFAAADRLNQATDEATTQKSTRDYLNDLSASQLETYSKTVYVNNTQFMYRLGKHSLGRKVAFTQNGYMILAPPLTVAGDEVHFIAFAETPFVLRPISNKKQRNRNYYLVGDCEIFNAQEELNKISEFTKLTII